MFKNRFFNFFNNNVKSFKKFNFNFSKKNFSNFNNNTGSGSSFFKYALLGFSIGGLGILSMNNYKHKATVTKRLLAEKSYNSQIVSTRVRDTVVYFCGGLGLTAGITSLMARSRFLGYAMSMPALLLNLVLTIGFMYKVKATPVNDKFKPVYFLGMNSCMAFSLCPLAAYIEAAVLRDAGILTLGLCSGLGLISATSRDDAFAGIQGYMGAGLGVLVALSLANIFLNSPVINNIWLYGGLALFSVIIMSDIKDVQIRAAKANHYDAMAESIHVYLDFINLFVRIAMILDNRKKK